MTNPGKRWSYYFKKVKADPERYQVYLEKDKQRKKRKKERLKCYVQLTLQALGNSVSRVKQVLPNSPRKRRAVISKLAKSVNGISSNSPNPHRNGISNSESQVLSVFKIFFTWTQFHDKHLGGKIMCQYGQKGRKWSYRSVTLCAVPQGSIPVISERAPRNKDTSQ